jgi:UDP-N-acetyl-D-glucosamine dehydrogenase
VVCRVIGWHPDFGIRNARNQGIMSTLEYISTTPSASLTAKLEDRTARIGVIGLGYVGLPLVLLFSEQKFRVTGFDIDARKVSVLTQGGSYIVRIPETEIQAAKNNGFSATSDYSQISNMDAIIIAVPTPLNDHHEPDLSFIEATAESIAPHLRPGQLVILESTTYPGTTEELLVPILEKNPLGLKAARDDSDPATSFYVAFSPEREDPGNDTVARCDIPKVVGGLNARATELGRQLYGTIFHRTVPVSTPAAAEMTKLLENIYRCVNIALVNELKLLSLRMGIDIWEVIAAASTKPFGFQPFYPGPGLGGHCIPIDPFYLSWKAKEYDFHTRFIELAGEINLSMPYHVVAAAAAALNRERKSLNGAEILVLGVAYKKDIDDLRESPALTIIELLQKEGATVKYNDPFFEYVGRGRKYNLEMKNTPLENLGQYDAIVIVTDHSSYDYASIVEQSKLVVDTRNATKGIQSSKIVRC